jgi:lysophospholipase L1-like esterase
MIKNNSVFVFEGDSVTDAGRGASVTDAGRAKDGLKANSQLGHGYAMMAASELLRRYPEKQLQFHNRGFSGDRISNQFPRWRLDCLNLKPDYVSICLGINDTVGKITHQNGEGPHPFARLYRCLLEWTREVLPEVRFILCQPYVFIPEAGNETITPAAIDELKEIGVRVKALASEFDGIYVPFFDVLEERIRESGTSYYLSDTVHPTHAGHALLAHTWLNAVCGTV